MPVRGALLAAAAAALAAPAVLAAGCAPAPEVVAGSPAPLTPVPSTTAPKATRSAASPAGQPTSRTASPATNRPAPVLPAAYATAELAGHGVTVRVPVPAGWTRRPTERGSDFVDATGTVLLRIELTARVPDQTLRESWADLEPKVAAQLAGYRRLDARDVPGYFDGALDWTFTFDSRDGKRQVIDRLLVSGPANVAVYFSALRPDFARLLPVWDRAQRGLAIS
jgi:hypothetical protein